MLFSKSGCSQRLFQEHSFIALNVIKSAVPRLELEGNSEEKTFS